MNREAVARGALVFAAVLAALAIAQMWHLGQSTAGIDYYQFWVVGEAVEHDDVHDPYADEERARMGSLFAERAAVDATALRQQAVAAGRTMLETYSTPFLYAAMHALAGGNYENDYRRWHALSLITFVAGFLALTHLSGFGWPAGLLLLALVAGLGAPIQSETQVGNVNRVQLGGLALVVALLAGPVSRGRDYAVGTLLGLLAMFKPNVVFVVILLIVRPALQSDRARFLAQCAGVAVGALIAFGSSVWFFGSASVWLDWTRTLPTLPDEIIRPSMGNYAPLLLVFGPEGRGWRIPLALLACLPILLALHERTAHPAHESRETSTLVGLGCVIFLFTASLVWEHYYVLALPLLIAVLHFASRAPARKPLGWITWRVLPGLALVGWLATPTYALSGLAHEVYFPVVQGGALVILYGLGLVMLLRPAEAETG